MRYSGADHLQILLAIRLAAVVLAPWHFGRIGAEVHAGDPTIAANLGAADAREERLGLIGGDLPV